ncbi:MAG: CheR family methyltransferase [Bacteroidota bacterium]|nr:CheR family methyltransferase [Bacteroidota bacterium]
MKTILKVTKKEAVTKKKTDRKKFPVVAIGASAGGLEAVSTLFANLPYNTGMAYIYVQHLNRNHKSMLTALLSKATKMKVQEIENMEKLEINNVYIIPHNKNIKVINGHIQLIPRQKKISTNLSIDVLFSSLALTHKKNVIGIILSGNAHDGTKGLKAIKKAGGITFAQDETAKYSSMPTSAINEGVVDHILPPEDIALELTKLSNKVSLHSVTPSIVNDEPVHDNDPDLNTIFALLHKNHAVDFGHYKTSTIKRRIESRILKTNLKTTKQYAKLVAGNKEEAELLYSDLLIHVTGFFRDTETFKYLKTTLLPKLLKDKKKGETLRIWVVACSTGQEAYSIAMLIREIQDKDTHKIPVQIFASDLSETAILRARSGEYTKNELKTVSASRIERFFTPSNGKHRIIQDIREMCIFGTSHNILRDPPFSRMDFISCRNLLIYFDYAAQKKVLTTLHFSLNEKGYLMLGKSETVGSSSSHFVQLNNKFKIYSRKKNSGIRKVPELLPRFVKQALTKKKVNQAVNKSKTVDSIKLDNVIDAILLSDYMPACAIINKDMEILQFRGSTSLFLQHPSGKATLNILKMTRPEFSFELINAIRKAIKTKQPVHKSEIEIKVGSRFRSMSLEVCPLKIEWDEPLLLIVFTLQDQIEKYIEVNKFTKDTIHALGNAQRDRKIEKLTEDLNTARTEIQAVIESQETAYEELQTANEEIISSNEEFQTLNEELESTKEEIEASNEELISSNKNLKKHNELLNESYNYSQTIIATIHEPMLVLDGELRVKSANKSFYKKFLVTKEETEGTLLFELGNKQWDIPELHELLENMLAKNSHFSNFEVTHFFPGLGEKTMLLNASRIIQKTHREKLILLAIKDITERSMLQRKANEKNDENIRMYKEDKIELENSVEERTKQLEQKNIELENAIKKLIFQNTEKEKRAAELSIANKELAFQNKEKEKRAAEFSIANTELAFQNKEKEMRANELIIANTELAFQNNEKEKRAAELSVANTELAFQNKEKEMRADELIIANTELAFQNNEKEKRAEELSVANKDLTAFTYISSHDLQEPLRKIQNFAACILHEEEKNLTDTGKGYFKRMTDTAMRMQQLIEDLLTYSRTKNSERIFEFTDLNILVKELEKDLENVISEKKAIIEVDLDTVKVIPFQFRQLLYNLVGNSLKFSKKDVPPHIILKSKIAKGVKLNNKYLTPDKKYCYITLTDNCIGFEPEYNEKIFEVFQRLHSKEEYHGTGIGLAICKRIVENHNGIITATGELGIGARFDIYISTE